MKSAENKIFEIDGASFNPESSKEDLSWRENFSMLKDVSHISSCIEGVAFIRREFEKIKSPVNGSIFIMLQFWLSLSNIWQSIRSYY